MRLNYPNKYSWKDCEICCETYPTEDFPWVGHEVCLDCIKKHIRVQVAVRGRTTVNCPTCETPIEYADIKTLAEPEVFEKYDPWLLLPDVLRFDELLLQRALQKKENFRWCTNSKCTNGHLVGRPFKISGIPALGKRASFVCAACGFSSCYTCQSPAHETKSCRRAKREMDSKSDNAASRKWLAKNTKTCRSCGRYCQKIEGCDHIICSAGKGGCGAEWCWRCGKEYMTCHHD
jgi:ariadne-1